MEWIQKYSNTLGWLYLVEVSGCNVSREKLIAACLKIHGEFEKADSESLGGAREMTLQKEMGLCFPASRPRICMQL